MKRLIRREFAFALSVMFLLTALHRSQRRGVIDCFVPLFALARSQSAATPLTGGAPMSTTPVIAPERDALRLAHQIIRERNGSPLAVSLSKGGLWLSGDLPDALARLQWIVGPENAELLTLEGDGEVKIDAGRLAKTARIEESYWGEAAGLLATYIFANEGLLLLLQITRSPHRYLLHIGRRAPTEAGEVTVTSALNLDNKFDSRINPRRRNWAKSMTERPPRGFDSIVAINASTRWLNMRTNLLVPPGNITFHELAEAYARVEFEFDYLTLGSCPGAHDTAVEREERLLSQRPFSNAVITKGINRILTTEDKRASSHIDVKHH
jgi:hypothetical protein